MNSISPFNPNSHLNTSSGMLPRARCLLVAAFLTCLASSYADTHQWAWITGSSTPEYSGEYGQQGIAAPENTPPGRAFAGSWADDAGQFWLYGGLNQTTESQIIMKADLWRFDPPTAQWVWINGSKYANQPASYGTRGEASPSNTPGARALPATWSDSEGNLWLFGGSTLSGSKYSDLWKYNIQTNQWVWIGRPDTLNRIGVYGIKGEAAPENIPHARDRSVCWSDSAGNFWLFGGLAPGGSNLNDLWKYDPVAGLWTWMTGSDTVSQLGVYGTKGEASTANTPGARQGSVGWRDTNSNLWLFGGSGRTGPATGGLLNDIWKYNLVDGKWTWMDGSTTADPQGVYGTMGRPDENNTPSGRDDTTGSADVSGNLWLFGGKVPLGSSSYSRQNDLWYYDITSGMWTWTRGSAQPAQYGTYGTKGIAGLANTPGVRVGASSFVDTADQFWMIGGFGYGEEPASGFFSDMWSLQLAPEAAISDWELFDE